MLSFFICGIIIVILKERWCTMFGYVRPYPPELKIREYEYYRGVYCGLCRAMGRCTGQCSRLTLSYDLVFLALTRLALLGGNPCVDKTSRAVHFDKKRCLPHPFRRRACLQPGDTTDYVACAAAVLGYHKILDDKQDETGSKRLHARLLVPQFRIWQRRAEQRYHGLSELISPSMSALFQMEATGLPSADEPASAFGQALGALFAHELNEPQSRIAHHIGYHVGRWLYFIDAIDDYDGDLRAGRPNPFYRLYGEDGMTQERREHLENALIVELHRACDALDLVHIDETMCGKELSPLLYHMLQTALPQKTHEILFPKCKQPSTKENNESL